jgi:hypothetical protein
METNELMQYFRNTSIATNVKHACPLETKPTCQMVKHSTALLTRLDQKQIIGVAW